MAKQPATKKPTAAPAPATKAEGPAARRERKAREREELQLRARREAAVRQAVKLVTHPCAPPHSRVQAATLLLNEGGLQDLPKDLEPQRAELEAQAKKLLPEPEPEAPPASAPAEAPPAPPAE